MAHKKQEYLNDNFGDSVERRLTGLRVIDLNGLIDGGMYFHVAIRLRYLTAVSKKPISFLLNTPGGDIREGLAIYDLMQEARKQCKITVKATGSCMSMGAVLLQGGDLRLSTPNTSFLLHELAGVAAGSLGQIRDVTKEAERLQQVLNHILSERTGKTIKQLQKLCERRDYFLSPQDALKHNLIDRIVE